MYHKVQEGKQNDEKWKRMRKKIIGNKKKNSRSKLEQRSDAVQGKRKRTRKKRKT